MNKGSFSYVALAVAMAFATPTFAEGFNYDQISTTDSVEFAASQSASAVIGKPVITSDETTIGNVDDIIINGSNIVVGYLVDVGGFLGIGSTPTYIPLDQTRLRIDGISVEVILNLTDAQLNAAVSSN